MSAAQRYSGVARALHWTIALLIVINIPLGLLHDALAHTLPAIPLHKAIGITVLALSLVRIVWRLAHPAPTLPDGMPGWEKTAAHGLHLLFYGLMLVLPLTGWAMISAGDKPFTWFGLFSIPKLAVSKGSVVLSLSHALHGPLGIIFGVLILLHVGAALRHHFVLRDDVLRRMLG
ncbi:MAG: cytochrome b [Sphingomonadales bacterium]|nr:cytochrome b [Sphingomonadales bacterium]MDE2168440.1 cytochrome b [Sphingomonadales bacterium]